MTPDNSSKPCPVVIKVGGSLLDWPELPARLVAYLECQQPDGSRLREQTLLIAGGGSFANLVRVMDQTHVLGDENAHRLAIRSMDLTAELLGALAPGCAVAHHLEEVSKWRALNRVPILAPGDFLEKLDGAAPDRLPASWDVTSDSIAARLAVRIGAKQLILLKSAPLSFDMTRSEAARRGLVDAWFPEVSSPLAMVHFVCLREQEAAARVLN
jgi:aspartokinase-like uncharacterized kinase